MKPGLYKLIVNKLNHSLCTQQQSVVSSMNHNLNFNPQTNVDHPSSKQQNTQYTLGQKIPSIMLRILQSKQQILQQKDQLLEASTRTFRESIEKGRRIVEQHWKKIILKRKKFIVLSNQYKNYLTYHTYLQKKNNQLLYVTICLKMELIINYGKYRNQAYGLNLQVSGKLSLKSSSNMNKTQDEDKQMDNQQLQQILDEIKGLVLQKNWAKQGILQVKLQLCEVTHRMQLLGNSSEGMKQVLEDIVETTQLFKTNPLNKYSIHDNYCYLTQQQIDLEVDKLHQIYQREEQQLYEILQMIQPYEKEKELIQHELTSLEQDEILEIDSKIYQFILIIEQKYQSITQAYQSVTQTYTVPTQQHQYYDHHQETFWTEKAKTSQYPQMHKSQYAQLYNKIGKATLEKAKNKKRMKEIEKMLLLNNRERQRVLLQQRQSWRVLKSELVERERIKIGQRRVLKMIPQVYKKIRQKCECIKSQVEELKVVGQEYEEKNELLIQQNGLDDKLIKVSIMVDEEWGQMDENGAQTINY